MLCSIFGGQRAVVNNLHKHLFAWIYKVIASLLHDFLVILLKSILTHSLVPSVSNFKFTLWNIQSSQTFLFQALTGNITAIEVILSTSICTERIRALDVHLFLRLAFMRLLGQVQHGKSMILDHAVQRPLSKLFFAFWIPVLNRIPTQGTDYGQDLCVKRRTQYL